MNFAELVARAMDISIFLIVLGLGLETELQDIVFVFRQPALLIRSILAMNGVMFGFALAVSLTSAIPSALKIALVSLAVSPVPPVLPRRQMKAGGTARYSIGLLVAATVSAIVLVPASIELVTHTSVRDVHISAAEIGSVAFVSVLLPLALGVAIARKAPDFSARIARPVSTFATALLIAGLLIDAVVTWPEFRRLVGDGAILFPVAFILIGLTVGHLLGGRDPNYRTVLALATGNRHPGIAMALVTLNFPEATDAMGLIVYYVLLGGIVSFPYVRWRSSTML